MSFNEKNKFLNFESDSFNQNLAIDSFDGSITYYELKKNFSNQRFLDGSLYFGFCIIDGTRCLDNFLKIAYCFNKKIPYVCINSNLPESRRESILKSLECFSHESQDLSTIAYVMFTSGTTGDPKGVQISRAQIEQYGDNLNAYLTLSSEDRVIQACELSFDLSLMQILLAWTNYATLCPIPSAHFLLAPRFILEKKITVFVAVPSVIALGDRAGIVVENSLINLKYAIFCGEGLRLDVANKLKKAAPNAKIFNTYGPTEATVSVTHFEVTESFLKMADHVNSFNNITPIGFPDENVKIAVFNSLGSQVCDEVGELFIGGPQVTLGYINREDLNSSLFFIKDNIRWYRTGDLAIESGDFGFLYKGRADRQIKYKGYRIELQDIEVALSRCGFKGAISVLPINNSSSEVEKLIAFFCDPDYSLLGVKELNTMLVNVLPGYMIPNSFVYIDSWPLSQNGKTDTRALIDFFIKERK